MNESANTQELQLLLENHSAGIDGAKHALIESAYHRMQVIVARLLNRHARIRGEQETTDILHECYLRLATGLDQVRPATVRQFMGFVSLQSRRVLLDQLRDLDGRGRNKRPKKVSFGDELHGGPVPEPVDSAIHPDGLVLDELLEAVDRLPDEEREVVDLLYLQEVTIEHAAELLEIHKATVQRRWAHARVKLAQWMHD